MIFLPKGVQSGEIVDPDELADEYIEAARVAQQATQWQWFANAFSTTSPTDTDVAKLARGAAVQMAQVKHEAALGVTVLTDPSLPDDVGASADLWKIPYNRGFHRVNEGDSEEALIEWVSEYPEMVVMIASYQYVRRDTGDYSGSFFSTAGRIPRAQFRLALDGGLLEGSGPYASPQDGKYRGLGIATKAMSGGAVQVRFTGAGAHNAELMAAQAPANESDNSGDGESEEATYEDDAPTDGVCVGSFRLIVLRFPFALPLMGA